MSHVREVSRTLRGDFILVLGGGATVTSSEGFRERVRDYLDRLRLSR
jgi:two-component system LytT family response regulator